VSRQAALAADELLRSSFVLLVQNLSDVALLAGVNLVGLLLVAYGQSARANPWFILLTACCVPVLGTAAFIS
jgi:hypothetical protein